MTVTYDPRHPHERTETDQQEVPVYDKDGRCLVCCRDELHRIEKRIAVLDGKHAAHVTASGRYSAAGRRGEVT